MKGFNFIYLMNTKPRVPAHLAINDLKRLKTALVQDRINVQRTLLKKNACIEIRPNLCRSHFTSQASFNLNKPSPGNYIPLDDFMEGLHCISKKGKDNWDENDKLLMQEILSFLSLEVKNSIADSKNSLTSLEALHYAFIVPYQWTETMREEILRPMFIQSGLITSEDHQDRLLFFTDIESICYNLQKSSTTRNPFKRGQNSVFCRFSCHNENEILIKLNLIQTTNNLSNFSGSMLFPRVMNSDSLSISADYIKASLKSLLTEKLFPIQQQDTNRKRYSIRTFLKDGLFPVYEDHIIIETMVEDIYSGSLPDMVI
ncbi:hypothetical protein HPULCUR_010343 [Helicostylum pulchrum]|uniref:Uncharacterized protein n=1 Tax=Helicostylum pulchrum TaxID=562976 RepID=A0ABP9YDE4_9FUNG